MTPRNGFARTCRAIIVLSLPLLSGPALAGAGTGGSITFQPDAAPIPVLGGAMLLLMGLMLAFIAFVTLRRHRGGATWFLGALATGALLSGMGGVKLISDASAGIPGAFLITNPGGQSFPLVDDQFHIFHNDSGTTQRVLNISLPSPLCGGGGDPAFPDPPESCTEGQRLGSGDSCEVDLRCSSVAG